MDNVSKYVPEEDRCQFCGREATLLCDMPSMTVVSSADFVRRVWTCDKRICTKCTTRVNAFDFCPECVKKIKLAKKGVANDRARSN